ncbi:putative membrane protein [Pararhizobium capsulatum DSM 1112]|uniref:Membrane protein n=1 Tax=Pararhizobium capsulatum DSM 1112 TaxID=1121113 RepID=A0ABU0BN72_9HYPH|nr:DUF2339 domain-containing protein [Pararhizobium capsulatum]MDQ0319711.1 putative membrane protein [Pararhizobium capsulatum DSM 1112]
MIEIVALVGFVIAIMALMNGRRTAERLETELEAIRAELKRLEATGVVAAPVQVSDTVLENSDATDGSSQEAPSTEPLAQTASSQELSRQEKVERVSSGEPWGKAPEEKTADTVASRPKESLESRLGARWAVWVGGVALALGGVFMVRYSIEAGLLSPAVRLCLATVFGLLLVGAGEFIRRRALPTTVGGFNTDQFNNAMIPGILTAAGAVTLFGVVYAAYGIYGFMGAGLAFILLGLVSLATVALSLRHGQALAGLGLFASMMTPGLISSESPQPWVLFGYLAVAWLATFLAARLRRWAVVPSLANIGLCLWSLVYIASSPPFEAMPVAFIVLVMVAGVGLVWPAGEPLSEGVPATAQPVAEEAGEDDTSGPREEVPSPAYSPWQAALQPPFAAIAITAAVSGGLIALGLVSPVFSASDKGVLGFVIAIVALACLGAFRANAIYAAMGAAIAAVLGLGNVLALGEMVALIDSGLNGVVATLPVNEFAARPAALALAFAFVVFAAAGLHLRSRTQIALAEIWAAIGGGVPAALVATSFVMTGNLLFDPLHGGVAALLGVILIALAEWLSRREETGQDVALPQAFLLAGSLAQFVIALHALTDGLATTILIALLGTAYVAATRLRQWQALPWMMVGAALVVLARIVWDPTIVGADALGRTPVFNALLAGYGIPALLLALCAWEMRNWQGIRIRNLLQAMASLFVLLTAAILIRHAMNDGVLDSAVPTLAEQSLYTLLAIGASGIFMALDLRSPSPIFRYGGMVIGVWSMLSVLSAHLFALNPYFSGERLGRFPVVDLLMIGYLLPGIGYGVLARYARTRRPMPYVIALAISAAIMIFAWATLSVRRFWQGDAIASWNGFIPGETYTYSVVWLLLGVILLAVGSRFDAKSLRITSAVLVFIAVLKVFLIDMANLEGFLRALSFIGLGTVLIGIGLFYQRILSSRALPSVEMPTAPEPATGT